MPGRTPRLLHFANYGASYPGSFIPLLTALGRAARARGWLLELIFSETAREQEWLSALEREGLGYRFIDLGAAAGPARWLAAAAAEATRGAWLGRVGGAIARMIAEYPDAPTILHTQFTMFDVPAAQAARRSAHATVVWHEQSARPTGAVGELGSSLRYRLFGRDVGAILCVAPDIAEIVARQGAAVSPTVLPNAVDTDRFAPDCLRQRASVRARLGLPDGASVLLHFGSHWERKGGDIFLAALAQLAGQAGDGASVRALMVGGGEARAAVDAAGLGEIATVLAPAERVEDLYAASDVFVSPSRAEGMPFAVLEALAVGTAVVASDIPGQAAIAQHVPSCRLSGLDPTSLAAAIRASLELDDETREREREATRAWIVENAGLGWWSRAVMAAYDSILEAGGGGGS